MQRVKTTAAMLLFIAMTMTCTAYGQEASEKELAKKTQNPVSDLISLPFQNNTNFNIGPLEGTQNILNVQPVWPFSLSEKWTVITRTILPVMSQPAMVPGQDRSF